MSTAKIVVDGKTVEIGSGTDFTTDDSLTMSKDNILGVAVPVKGVTKDEFASMSKEQKQGLVVVTDENMPGLVSGGEVYSDEEVVIGTWFGKPLYRKVIHHKTPAASNKWETIVTGHLGWGYMQVVNFSVADSNNNLFAIFDSFQYQYISSTGEVKMYIKDGDYWSNRDVYTIFEYTKTID